MAVRTVLGSVALVAVLAAAAAVMSFRAVYEPDLWYHLAQGRENAAGRIVRENTFSFTAPEYRQQYAPWLFDASAYGAWRAAGGTGIQAIQAFLIAAALLMAYRAARHARPLPLPSPSCSSGSAWSSRARFPDPISHRSRASPAPSG